MSSFKLSVSANQSLNPTITQSIKILQLSSQELQNYLDTEIEQNPLLSEDEGGIEEAEELESEEEYFDYYQLGIEDTNSSFEDFTPEIESTREKIIKQIGLSFKEEPHYLIAIYLLDLIDGAGYLTIDTKTIAKTINCPLEVLEKIITKLQTLEPVGIFARNLAECLKIQLIDKNIFNPSYDILLCNLDMLAKGDLKSLAKLCNLDFGKLNDMIKVIKSLNPKPLATTDHDPSLNKIPDLFVKKIEGKYIIELNEETLPKIHLKRDMYQDIRNKYKNQESTKKYMSENYSRANLLINALMQRANTILKVANAIIESQQSFLEYGILYLRPMKFSQISSLLSMSESTISRVVNNKYIATPRGTFELKFFFSKALSGEQHSETSSNKKIQAVIKNLIENEDTNNIYSDDNLVIELKKFNINVARRTIAKYRSILKIPSSVERKKLIQFAD